MERYVFGAGCFLILLSIGMAVWLRHCLVRYTFSLSSCLDQMIKGEREIIFDEEYELLMSKVQVKLRQLYEILRVQAELNEKEKKSLEEIITDISHQVKTPIANIRLYHRILEKRELSGEQMQEFLQIADGQVEKLDVLMKSMIAVSRMETGLIQTDPSYQRISPLIEQAVCGIALKAEKKQIEMEIHCEDWMKAVYDRKWTLEALENILDNAVKYTKEQGHIRISVQVTDFFVGIHVEDDGKGIPQEHYTRVFRRFYREESVQQEEGVGIGLFLAKEIIRKQKGYIGLKSEPGQGSVFSIYLPAE